MDLQSLLVLLSTVASDANREAVEGAVEAGLTRALPEIFRRAKLPVYLSKTQLCELTGWSERKVEYLKAERRISFIRRGRTVLFPTAEIEAYLREGYVPAKSSAYGPSGRGAGEAE